MTQSNDTSKLVPLREAFAKVASVDVHDETLRRWHRRGVGGIKLKAWRVAGQLVTTETAMRDFIEKTNSRK